MMNNHSRPLIKSVLFENCFRNQNALMYNHSAEVRNYNWLYLPSIKPNNDFKDTAAVHSFIKSFFFLRKMKKMNKQFCE